MYRCLTALGWLALTAMPLSASAQAMADELQGPIDTAQVAALNTVALSTPTTAAAAPAPSALNTATSPSAPTFSQLSHTANTPQREPAANTNSAPDTSSGEDGLAVLAGIAALGFVMSRHRRPARASGMTST